MYKLLTNKRRCRRCGSRQHSANYGCCNGMLDVAPTCLRVYSHMICASQCWVMLYIYKLPHMYSRHNNIMVIMIRLLSASKSPICVSGTGMQWQLNSTHARTHPRMHLSRYQGVVSDDNSQLG